MRTVTVVGSLTLILILALIGLSAAPTASGLPQVPPAASADAIQASSNLLVYQMRGASHV